MLRQCSKTHRDDSEDAEKVNDSHKRLRISPPVTIPPTAMTSLTDDDNIVSSTRTSRRGRPRRGDTTKGETTAPVSPILTRQRNRRMETQEAAEIAEQPHARSECKEQPVLDTTYIRDGKEAQSSTQLPLSLPLLPGAPLPTYPRACSRAVCGSSCLLPGHIESVGAEPTFSCIQYPELECSFPWPAALHLYRVPRLLVHHAPMPPYMCRYVPMVFVPSCMYNSRKGGDGKGRESA
jgi:hypothetical protein